MRRSKLRWGALVTMAATAGVGLWLLVPMAFGGGDRAQQQQLQVTCRLANPQPFIPLELNTVAVQNVAKTVAQEKEVYECLNAAGQIEQVWDVETVIELVENATATGVVTVDRRIEVMRCRKDVFNGGVACKAVNLPAPAVVRQPLLGCQPAVGPGNQPIDPVEMNSTPVGEFIKTIKLDKEVFFCRLPAGPPFIVDLYIFTEIIERKATIATGITYRPIKKAFEGFACQKLPNEPNIRGCNRVAIAALP